jgi:hypothetical protein
MMSETINLAQYAEELRGEAATQLSDGIRHAASAESAVQFAWTHAELFNGIGQALLHIGVQLERIAAVLERSD